MSPPIRFLLQHEPPPVGPLGIVAVVDVSAGQCTVVVNAAGADPLNNPAALGNPAKWTMAFNSTLYQGIAIVNSSFDRFIVQFSSVGISLGGNTISYTNAPSDIETVSGRKLPAVSNQGF